MSLKSMASRFFSKDKDNSNNDNSAERSPASYSLVTLSAHMDGNVLKLEEVDDQTFACGALGPGAVIEPTRGRLVAPADGKITVAFPTGHAVGMRTSDGLEVLMHIGFDTVELDGRFFNPVVVKGQEVRRGDVLVEFEMELIREAGYKLTTPLVITNAKNHVASTNLVSDIVSTQFVEEKSPFLELKVKDS